jgi:hypothetical protein
MSSPMGVDPTKKMGLTLNALPKTIIMPTDFSHVPYDILVEILGYFSPLDILQLRMVSI